MADIRYITERVAFTSQALATLGGSPEWDAALRDYLACEALSYADGEFGDFAKANEVDDRRRYDLEARYGKDPRSDSNGAIEWEAMWEAIRAAEERQADQYLRPLWKAGRALAQTPAPTFQAAVFKTTFIARDEVWNDGSMEADCMALIAEDFARLQGGA